MTDVSAADEIASARGIGSVWLHMAGLSLVFVGTGMVFCAGVDAMSSGHATLDLLLAGAVTLALGLAAWKGSRIPNEIRPRQVFIAVSASWLVASTAGALPFLFSGLFHRFDDALFESISGFTCTGSSVMSIADFDLASPGVIMWRQLTQWFGGMGIIVLAVAVLPFLGVGGLELIRAEAPGPTSDRLAPRVKETAKRLWVVYAGFTGVTVVALLFSGLDLFDSFGVSMALVSTGGFAPEAASVGHYDSLAIELVLVVGMIIGGASFTLHYNALRGKPGVYLRNAEFRMYLAVIAVGTLLVTLTLTDGGHGVGTAVRAALFNVVTLATSSGFGSATGPGAPGDFALWAPAAQAILFLLMWTGGMTGSTSGGLKILRAQVMGRVAWRELRRARRPRAVIPIRQDGEVVGEDIVGRIGAFVLIYFLVIIVVTTLLAMAGTDTLSSLSGAVSAMGNMGPALGDAGPTSNFAIYSAPERMALAALMLVGRLEVFPVTLALVTLVQRLRHPMRDFAPRI